VVGINQKAFINKVNILYTNAQIPYLVCVSDLSLSFSVCWTFTCIVSSFTICKKKQNIFLYLGRVSDPHWFNADPDTDPDLAFFLIADPECGSGSRIPDPDLGFDDLKLKIKIIAGNLISIFLIKNPIYLSLGLHKGRPSYWRSFQPSKENIQYLKTWKFWTFFYFCESFLPSWLKLMRIHADPDPKPCKFKI
jgi:hypothetical protein